MLVLQLRSGFHLVGFLYPADDLGTGARRAAEPTPPPEEEGIETLLSGALGDGERITGVGSLLCPFPADDLGTGARKSRNASEPTPPRQLIKPPEQSQGICDGEGIGAGAASSWWETGTAAGSCSTAPPPTLGQQETNKTSSAPSSSTTSTATRGSSRSPSDAGDAGGEDWRDGGEELGCPDRDGHGLVGGDGGGGEDHGRRLLLQQQQQQQQQRRTLRLRGGAADYYHAAAVPASHSWVAVMGLPMVQTIPRTCALVAATVCVEAQHRRKFEAAHGPETFACRAAAPRKLRQACFRDKAWNPSSGKQERTWDPNKGAWSMDRVLRMMHSLGGARTTNASPPAPFFLPLTDWERYGRGGGGGLTAGTAARLLYERGPCIGTLFATTRFFDTFVVPGSCTPPAVFRGCPREDREEVEQNDPNAAMHAVVCFAYSHTNAGRLCIFVLDSQRASGPVRCVNFDEFDDFYVLHVDALSPLHLLGSARFPPLVYPVSGY